MKSIDVLLLSRADVVGLALTPTEVVSVVEGALREHAAILKAIEEKDATKAAMLRERHLDITYKGVEGLSHKTRN